MCYHLWNFYQLHSWVSLLVESDDKVSFRLWLHYPTCSHRVLHAQNRFDGVRGDITVDISFFGTTLIQLPLEVAILGTTK